MPCAFVSHYISQFNGVKMTGMLYLNLVILIVLYCLFQFPKDLFKLNITEEIGYEENGLPEKVRS